jgi:hypothetical protein
VHAACRSRFRSICVDPRDARTLRIAFSCGGVWRSDMPQQHAYDLIYRHGMTIDATGNLLAIGSTTGGLWISEDQGDHWQGIDA